EPARERAEAVPDSESTVEAPEISISTRETTVSDTAEGTTEEETTEEETAEEETAAPVTENRTDEAIPQTEAAVGQIPEEREQTAEVVVTAEPDEYSTEEAASESSEEAAPTTPEITFGTVTEENGSYRDEYEYVFYDDPSVHGTWRAYRVLPGDTDITGITRSDIFNAADKSGLLYEFITVYPDGTLAFYQPRPENIVPTNVWTNGYYISSPTDGGLVCRMKAITLENGKEYLILEQRCKNIYENESFHRYVIYNKVVIDD
ncbi:MAG: hypothetical protein ACI4XA_02975, partial [Oscillospiraceae bacterium]